MFCDDINGIVVHTGHLKSYVGFIGDETPLYQSDTAIVTEEGSSNFRSFEQFGVNLNRFSLVKPLIQAKAITNIETYAEFVSRLARKINVDIDESGIFLANHDHAGSLEERKQMATQFFEKHNTAALYFCSKSVSALFSSGRVYGTLVDSGAEFTDIAPIYDGYLLRQGWLISLQKCTVWWRNVDQPSFRDSAR